MGEPKGAAIWNRTPKPSMRTQGMQSSYEQGNRVAGAAYVSSRQMPNRSEKMEGTGPTRQMVGNNNVRATGYETPSADISGVESGKDGMYHGL